MFIEKDPCRDRRGSFFVRKNLSVGAGGLLFFVRKRDERGDDEKRKNAGRVKFGGKNGR